MTSNFSPTTPYSTQSPTREIYTVINEEYNEVALQLLEPQKELPLVKQFQEMIVNEHGEKYALEAKDITTLIRFLKARNFDLTKSYKLWLSRMQWIEQFQPHKIDGKDVESELKSGQLFWYGRDYFGRPIVYVRTCNHYPVQNERETEQFFKYFVYMCEMGVLNVPKPPYNQFVIVSDQSHLGRRNLDIRGYKRLFCLADYYPEIIHSIHLLYQPTVFTIMYKIGKQFLDKKTLAKIQLKSKQRDKLREEMKKITAQNCLLPDHFGPKDPSQRAINSYLPEVCPKEYVYAEMKAKSNGTMEEYKIRDDDEDEEEIPSDTPSTPVESDGVNDLDLD